MPAVPPSQSTTLFERYLAHCGVDAGQLLEQVCRDASVPAAGSGIWVTPAQREARKMLPELARAWAALLAKPPQPPRPNTAPAPFATTDFGVPTGLALMSDDDVDEDIESTRVVQVVEATAEWNLRELRARLAGAINPGRWAASDPLPLAPARLVGTLCTVLHESGLDPTVRLAALRLIAEPLAEALPRLYQRHVQLLDGWGLRPTRYAIVRDPEPGSGAPDSSIPAQAATLARIPELLVRVAEEAGLSDSMQSLLVRLAGPFERSIAAYPQLLDSVDNPLWRLVDRLAAIGQLDSSAADDPFQLPLHLRLEPIVADLEAAKGALSADRYTQALAAAEAEAGEVAAHTRPLIGELASATPLTTVAQKVGVPIAAAPVVLTEPMVAAAERRRDFEPLVRGQMVARLRDTEVLPEIKQFLLGPWLSVVVESVVCHGEESPEAQDVLGAVELFIAGGHYRLAAPLTAPELHRLRDTAEHGLKEFSALPGAKVHQLAEELRAALATWPRNAPLDSDFIPPPASAPASPGLDDSIAWPGNEHLPTVPAALDSHNPDERAMRACEAWLDGLAVGDICRIQRQGQWTTLRLNWRGEVGSYFAFGNSYGLAFCASRRVLGRMRLEGLATTMPRGQWLQQAMRTLPTHQR